MSRRGRARVLAAIAFTVLVAALVSSLLDHAWWALGLTAGAIGVRAWSGLVRGGSDRDE